MLPQTSLWPLLSCSRQGSVLLNASPRLNRPLPRLSSPHILQSCPSVSSFPGCMNGRSSLRKFFLLPSASGLYKLRSLCSVFGSSHHHSPPHPSQPRAYHSLQASYGNYGVPQMLGVGPRHATTILCIRKGNQVCMAGDGMVSQGSMIIKPNARKIRRLSSNVIMGFAGATADCFTLAERLETRLEEYPGQLLRACVELAKQWRTDRYLRHLEAVLIVADDRVSLEVTGNGDVLETHDGILGVGSGGPYAVAAAKALQDIDGLGARDIALKAMKIAGSMCCHTNDNLLVEVIETAYPYSSGEKSVTSTSSSETASTSSSEAESTSSSPDSSSSTEEAKAEDPSKKEGE